MAKIDRDSPKSNPSGNAMTPIIQELLPFAIVVSVLAIAWLLLRDKPAAMNTVADFDRRAGQGRPVVVKFFANT